MTLEEFHAICGALPATTLSEPFGPGTHVWKVGGKMFAAARADEEGAHARINFKVPDDSFELLGEEPGLRPAPYMARAKWIQVETADALSNADIEAYLRYSHGVYAAKLTKAKRAELGL